MIHRFKFSLLLVAGLLLSACASTDLAINTAQTQAAGNDRYTTLAAGALANDADPTSGLESVSPADLANTPDSVRLLLSKLLDAIQANRLAAHSVVFQLGAGPDPAGLDLTPVTLPEVADPNNDSLLDEE